MSQNKILLMLGASSDIGCELIKRNADKYDVILAHYCRSDERLKALQQQIGDKIQLLQADFMDRESVQHMIEEIRQRDLSPTHIVHLSAPKFYNVKFAKSSWEQFEEGLQTSLRSIVEIARAFVPVMAKAKFGRVVFMLTSCVQNTPPKYLSPYVTAKYALLGLMKSLAVEYADKGVSVNGVSPDMIETRFLSDISDIIVQKNAMDSPIGRNLTADDVMPVFEYLLSDEAAAITGQNIAITGGR